VAGTFTAAGQQGASPDHRQTVGPLVGPEQDGHDLLQAAFKAVMAFVGIDR
jgi:hypothetical protein